MDEEEVHGNLYDIESFIFENSASTSMLDSSAWQTHSNESLNIQEDEDSLLDCSVIERDQEHDPLAPMSQQLTTSINPQRVAFDWLQKFNVDHSDGLHSLFELIFHSIGIGGLSLTYDYETIKNLNPEILDKWIKQSDFEPHIQDQQYHQNLCLFFRTILTKKLLDVQFMEPLQHVLDTMYHCHYSCARLAAVILQGEMIEESAKFLQNLREELNSYPDDRWPLPKCNQYYKMKNYVLEQSKFILQSLRDVELVVRKQSFKIFAHWLEHFPEYFVKDNNLRFVYWQLYDASTSMRILAIESCCVLLLTDNSDTDLTVFATHCLPELYKMTSDPSTQVALKAIKAISSIYRQCPRMLTGLNLQDVFILVLCNRPSVASAAALFLCDALKNRSGGKENMFLADLIEFLYTSEVTLGCNCERVFVEVIFPQAGLYLTEWSAWINLLTEDTYKHLPKLAEVACRLFVSVAQFTVTGSFTSKICPSIDEYFIPEITIDLRENPLCKNHQLEMTSAVASSMTSLWRKYKDHLQCLLPLLSLPRYFCCNGHVDFKTLCLGLILISHHCSDALEEVCITLAGIHKLMLSANEWKQQVPNLERLLFEDIIHTFPRACVETAACLNQQNGFGKHFDQLKRAYYLLKYFNLTQTTLKEAVFEMLALCNGEAYANSLMVYYVIPMALHMIEWQLKDILNFTSDQAASLRKEVFSLTTMLDKFLRAKNSSIRALAYTLLCKLLELFSPTSEFTRDMHERIKIQPDIFMSEWLNFNVHVLVPYDLTFTDARDFHITARYLEQFCSLLTSGILHISYISTILPYFLLHSKDKNYNAILERVFQELSCKPDFPFVIVESLATFNKVKGTHMAKMVAEGLCSVGLSKLIDPEATQAVSLIITCKGFLYISAGEDFSLLAALSYFVPLLSKPNASLAKSRALSVYSTHLDHPCVQEYLNSFHK
uniref:SCD domain-containing protein n=1 Tax=Graphocephala atropunctata TaxID=36148 RepID=A0A1B6KLP4_9HEMI